MLQAAVSTLLQRLPDTADVLVHSIDVVRERALLVGFDAKAYRTASFLDERILTPQLSGSWIGLQRFVKAARGMSATLPLQFIFHTGHVGSTLVSRLIDEAGSTLGLREPLALRQLAAAHDDLDRPDSLLSRTDFDELLDALLRSWGRGYPNTRSVVLKATSAAGRIAPLVLARQPQTRAIYLNVRAESYIANLLAGQNSAIDLRALGQERIRRLIAFGASAVEPLHQLSPGEFAAMGWLAETWSQHNALEAGGTRSMAIDFDAFLIDIAEVMARIVNHLGVAHDATYLAGIERSPVLTRYAKGPEHAFSPQMRAQVLAQSRARNGEEIRKGLEWLERMARADARAAQVMAHPGL